MDQKSAQRTWTGESEGGMAGGMANSAASPGQALLQLPWGLPSNPLRSSPMKQSPALLRFVAELSPSSTAMALTTGLVRSPRGNMKCCKACAGTEARKQTGVGFVRKRRTYQYMIAYRKMDKMYSKTAKEAMQARQAALKTPTVVSCKHQNISESLIECIG
ncbi:MAG: hypothetical protein FRX49_01124 [Trebouxia sp. A1-2]|nr:MAG: hypothetical protein FRX49_01124 [Trebouxia sp. A1-2]